MSRPLFDLVSILFKTISYSHLQIRALRQKAFNDLFIISVDSLSFGGAGKTPLVMAIGRALEERGAKFAVISRGYRSRFEKRGIRVSNSHTCKEVGDEPLMLKSRFPNQDIFIGRDRLRSITEAAARNDRILILDDGFQSSHIRKDFSIMLINPKHPYFYLRHFRFLARRASRTLTYRPAGPATGDTYDFAITKFFDAGGREVEIAGAPLVAFSALGDNGRFAEDMGRYRLISFRSFPDHHAYGLEDIRTLESWRREKGASWMICTEKDFCKIKDLPFHDFPLLYARNEIKLPDDIITRIIQDAKEKGFI